MPPDVTGGLLDLGGREVAGAELDGGDETEDELAGGVELDGGVLDGLDGGTLDDFGGHGDLLWCWCGAELVFEGHGLSVPFVWCADALEANTTAPKPTATIAPAKAMVRFIESFSLSAWIGAQNLTRN